MRRGRWTIAAGVALLAAGCGGAERQDADEPRGTWRVSVEEAAFPASQRISQPARMTISVRNQDTRRAIPNLAVTVSGFSRRLARPGLSDPTRPVWIIDRPPTGGTTAYTNTWALGRVPPGGERTFTWRVTPVVAGRRELRWRVAAGLDGKAKAVTSGGRAPSGTFTVDVDDTPPETRVDPDSGEVVSSDT